MTPACTTCRWYQVYRCPCVRPACRFNRPEFVDNGLNCRKYKERPDG